MKGHLAAVGPELRAAGAVGNALLLGSLLLLWEELLFFEGLLLFCEGLLLSLVLVLVLWVGW